MLNFSINAFMDELEKISKEHSAISPYTGNTRQAILRSAQGAALGGLGTGVTLHILGKNLKTMKGIGAKSFPYGALGAGAAKAINTLYQPLRPEIYYSEQSSIPTTAAEGRRRVKEYIHNIGVGGLSGLAIGSLAGLASAKYKKLKTLKRLLRRSGAGAIIGGLSGAVAGGSDLVTDEMRKLFGKLDK